MVLHLALHNFIFSCSLNFFVFVRDIAKVKSTSNFINMNEYVVKFIGISEYIHMSCTLALSHRLAWFLEPTGVNLRALGVFHWQRDTSVSQSVHCCGVNNLNFCIIYLAGHPQLMAQSQTRLQGNFCKKASTSSLSLAVVNFATFIYKALAHPCYHRW